VELRQLRYFVTLAEELHFGRAAARLEIATPTLSQQTAALERSLGHALLHRTSRAVALTPAGEALLEEARLVLAAAERAVEAVATAGASSQTLRLRVSVGVVSVLRQQFPALEHHPRLDLHLLTSNPVDVETVVLHGTADAAFVWGRDRYDPVLRSLQLTSCPVVLAVSAAHPLARQEVVPVSRLRAERLVLFPRSLSPAVYDRCLRHLLQGQRPAPGQVVDEGVRGGSPDAMLRLVASGQGVAPFVADVVAHHDLVSTGEVVLKPIDTPLQLPVDVVWREPARPQLVELLDQLAPTGTGR
jgi:DNA-binding transcriptional LysR family regulator